MDGRIPDNFVVTDVLCRCNYPYQCENLLRNRKVSIQILVLVRSKMDVVWLIETEGRVTPLAILLPSNSMRDAISLLQICFFIVAAS